MYLHMTVYVCEKESVWGGWGEQENEVCFYTTGKYLADVK